MKSVLVKYPKLKIYYVMVGGLSMICSVLLLYATNAMSTLTAHITTNGLINISIYIYKVLLLFICFHFVDHVLFRKMKTMVQEYLHQQVYCQLSNELNRQKLNDFNESGLYALIQSDAEDSISFLSDTFIDIIYQLIRLAMVLVYIFVINIQLSCFYVLSTIISILVQKKFSASVSKANEDTKQKEIAMNTILQNLRDYTVKHFADEEAYMESIHYNKIFTQKIQHQEFVQKLDEFMEHHKEEVEDQDKQIMDILEFLTEWLVNHILHVDGQIPKME